MCAIQPGAVPRVGLRHPAQKPFYFCPERLTSGIKQFLSLIGDHGEDAPAVVGAIGLVSRTFRDILDAVCVPAANEVQCGWGANHSLTGAQEAVRRMLEREGEWGDVSQ